MSPDYYTECTCPTGAQPGPHDPQCATETVKQTAEQTQADELTWEDVWAAIGREVWKLAPQDFQDSGHRDLVFGTCWQNIMYAVDQGIRAVAELPDEVKP